MLYIPEDWRYKYRCQNRLFYIWRIIGDATAAVLLVFLSAVSASVRAYTVMLLGSFLLLRILWGFIGSNESQWCRSLCSSYVLLLLKQTGAKLYSVAIMKSCIHRFWCQSPSWYFFHTGNTARIFLVEWMNEWMNTILCSRISFSSWLIIRCNVIFQRNLTSGLASSGPNCSLWSIIDKHWWVYNNLHLKTTFGVLQLSNNNNHFKILTLHHHVTSSQRGHYFPFIWYVHAFSPHLHIVLDLLHSAAFSPTVQQVTHLFALFACAGIKVSC